MRPKEGDLWGRKLANVAWTVYGAVDYLQRNGATMSSPEDLGHHPLIGWEETVGGIMAADWLNRAVSGESVVYRTNSLINQLVAAKAGIGLALLPCYLGDGDSALARALLNPVPDLSGELWIVTHADLRGTARVRAFFDLVGDGLAREHYLFEGQS
jgi:DNA-binding transcriptional LysR family regulator